MEGIEGPSAALHSARLSLSLAAVTGSTPAPSPARPLTLTPIRL
jgi:hypothetical protein